MSGNLIGVNCGDGAGGSAGAATGLGEVPSLVEEYEGAFVWSARAGVVVVGVRVPSGQVTVIGGGGWWLRRRGRRGRCERGSAVTGRCGSRRWGGLPSGRVSVPAAPWGTGWESSGRVGAWTFMP